MEQMYLVEILIDRVTVFASDEQNGPFKRNLIVKVRFGPNTQFIIKEGQLSADKEKKDPVIENNKEGRKTWTKIFRVGKSYLFPSYPDTVLSILDRYPMEIEVWDDEENENELFLGNGIMYWDTHFFHVIKESAVACKLHKPLSIKQLTPLMDECCCKQIGEIFFIVRLSALGDTIITDFQQPLKNPHSFLFKTDNTLSVYQCKSIEPNDPNYHMTGSVYESALAKDPGAKDKVQKDIQVCTELQSCGFNTKGEETVCKKDSEEKENNDKKKYPLDKIRMGDITGPCGNTNCVLAHKVRTYLRHLENYTKEAKARGISMLKGKVTNNICGKCDCKDDRYHRGECTKDAKDPLAKSKCKGCGGVTPAGETCEDRKRKFEGAMTTVGYVFNVNTLQGFTSSENSKKIHAKGKLEADVKLENIDQFGSGCCCSMRKQVKQNHSTTNSNIKPIDMKNYEYGMGCSCGTTNKQISHQKQLAWNITSKSYSLSSLDNVVTAPDFTLEMDFPDNTTLNEWSCSYNKQLASKQKQLLNNVYSCNLSPKNKVSTRSVCTSNPMIYNAEVKDLKRKVEVHPCSDPPDDKDCKCNPPKPTPPCNKSDCDCLTETFNIAARKSHKAYCPLFKHKSNCPVSLMNEVNEEKMEAEDSEDKAEPIPYGLPPVKLGPCRVMGKPCCVPDGFARMYKTGAMAPLPPSHSEAGKVCCSKEFERIKRAINEYLKNEKENDYRCINTFNVDTERRCCDKEQVLMSLMGKSCCGSHKIALKEKFKDESK